MINFYSFPSLKSMKKGDGSGVGFGAGSEPIVRGKGPSIRIRIPTKMLRILNNAKNSRGLIVFFITCPLKKIHPWGNLAEDRLE
jgi:hypothetical protein